MIRPFDLHQPSALAEVGALLADYGDAAALYAGGTELLLLMKEGFIRPRVLVDVSNVATRTRVLGTEVEMPLMVAPTSLQRTMAAFRARFACRLKNGSRAARRASSSQRLPWNSASISALWISSVRSGHPARLPPVFSGLAGPVTGSRLFRRAVCSP